MATATLLFGHVVFSVNCPGVNVNTKITVMAEKHTFSTYLWVLQLNKTSRTSVLEFVWYATLNIRKFADTHARAQTPAHTFFRLEMNCEFYYGA
jgi:hypothetical protein